MTGLLLPRSRWGHTSGRIRRCHVHASDCKNPDADDRLSPLVQLPPLCQQEESALVGIALDVSRVRVSVICTSGSRILPGGQQAKLASGDTYVFSGPTGFIPPEVMQAKQLLEALGPTCSGMLPLLRGDYEGQPRGRHLQFWALRTVTSLAVGVPGSRNLVSCPRDVWVSVPGDGFPSAEKRLPPLLLWKVPPCFQLSRWVFPSRLIPFGPSCTKFCLELAVGAQR